jgi:hypothetical protein
MNAVERLLAQGEQLLALYDEMYRERIGDARDPTLPAVPKESILTIGRGAISAVPRGSSYWVSPHWLQAAAEAAWLEAKAANVEPSSKQVIARTTEIFLERLSQREQLLSDATWRQLIADVVLESRAWEPLSAKVVALAEQVWQAVKEVSLLSESIEPKWWRHDRFAVFLKPLSSETTPAKRARLRQDLDLLHPYAQPPKHAASTSEKQTSTAKQKKRRDRKGIGGRPEKFTMKFIREVFTARERDKKQAAKARMPLPGKAEWLSDYCTAKDIDLRKQFPPAIPGEEWRVRANRFWKAATKRLREAETNRH